MFNVLLQEAATSGASIGYMGAAIGAGSAAIGAGLDIHEPVGNMVIDVGGGTSEVAVISLGGIVALEAKRVGSFDIDTAIQNHVRKEHGVAIGERTAEEIKLATGRIPFPKIFEFSKSVLTENAPSMVNLCPSFLNFLM